MVDEMQRTPMKFIKPTRPQIGKPQAISLISFQFFCA